MNGQTPASSADLAVKITRLVEERGWNQEDLARFTGLNRQTVREILQHDGDRQLRNRTVAACAKALGLSVSDLRDLPLERLLRRLRYQAAANGEEKLQRLYEQAMQPELLAWLKRNPDRARRLTQAEIDELLSLQGTGGPLTSFGLEQFVEAIERKRRLLDKVHAIAGTDQVDLLEKLVDLLFEKVQPYRDRA